MKEYTSLLLATILPAVFTAVFTLLERKTAFKSINKTAKQIIYGICFGGLAVYGTEFGIPINGAQINVRDASVLTAGLLFGPLAGIIAGLIGGIERYFAVLWGVGTFTQIACTVSTSLAGFYSAALRKYMFKGKNPGWLLALAIGMVMEVFHMTMVFITNISDVNRAIQVVEACSVIMISANTIATSLSSFVSDILDGRNLIERGKKKISQTIQRWLLICIIIAFAATSLFVYNLQTGVADAQTNNLLSLAIEDVKGEVEDASDANLLETTRQITSEVLASKTYSLEELCIKYDVADIHLIGNDGIIFKTSDSDSLGFDMNSGDQSRAFLKLLDGDIKEYVQEYMPISMDQSIQRKYAAVTTSFGFLQVGYNAINFQNDIASEVTLAARNRRVGETGYIVIADKDFNIVSATKGKQKATLKDYGFELSQKPEEVFTTNIDGEDCYCLYREAEGYFIVSCLPVTEAYHTRNVQLYANTFMEVLVFAVVYAMINRLIMNAVVSKIDDVNASLNKITAGDLSEVVDVKTNIEFETLSKDINETVDTLKRYIKEASQRIDAELEYAKNIQYSSLPHSFPNDSRIEMYGLMDAAKEVGGDFYDVYKLDDHTLNFLIADVSGKSIPGAMFMMRAKSVLRSLTETGKSVDEVFTDGNNSLCNGNDAGMFVTAWEGSIDLNTGVVKYACAGHNPPVLKHANGTSEFIKGKPGFVLAGMENVKYKIQEFKMEKGDILFLYTDGVTEATTLDKQLFGEERLLETLNKIDSSVEMDYLACEVIGEVGRFVGAAEQFDDITMIALKYKG